MTLVAISLPAVAAPNETTVEMVAIRITAKNQALAVFNKGGECLRDSSVGATITGAQGTVISHATDYYTLHHGQIIVATSSQPICIATTKGGCRVPAHSRAALAYSAGSKFQVNLLNGKQAIAVRVREGAMVGVGDVEQVWAMHPRWAMQRSCPPQASSPTITQRGSAMFGARNAGSPSRIFAQRGSVLTFSQDSRVKLLNGRLLICPTSTLEGGTDVASFKVRPNEFVAMEKLNGRTRIHAINQADCLQITTVDGLARLDCGRELLIANGAHAGFQVLASDGIGRRILRQGQTVSGNTIAVSEYSMLGMMKYHPAARALRADNGNESRRILAELVKTCAAVEYVTHSHGNYVYAETDTMVSLAK
jgi:hypothetical protein